MSISAHMDILISSFDFFASIDACKCESDLRGLYFVSENRANIRASGLDIKV